MESVFSRCRLSIDLLLIVVVATANIECRHPNSVLAEARSNSPCVPCFFLFFLAFPAIIGKRGGQQTAITSCSDTFTSPMRPHLEGFSLRPAPSLRLPCRAHFVLTLSAARDMKRRDFCDTPQRLKAAARRLTRKREKKEKKKRTTRRPRAHAGACTPLPFVRQSKAVALKIV